MISAGSLRTIFLTPISQPPQHPGTSQKKPGRAEHDPTRHRGPPLPLINREPGKRRRRPRPNLEVSQPRPHDKVRQRPKNANHHRKAVSHSGNRTSSAMKTRHPKRPRIHCHPERRSRPRSGRVRSRRIPTLLPIPSREFLSRCPLYHPLSRLLYCLFRRCGNQIKNLGARNE